MRVCTTTHNSTTRGVCSPSRQKVWGSQLGRVRCGWDPCSSVSSRAPRVPVQGALPMPTDPLLEVNGKEPQLVMPGNRLQGEVCVVCTLLCVCFSRRIGSASKSEAITHTGPGPRPASRPQPRRIRKRAPDPCVPRKKQEWAAGRKAGDDNFWDLAQVWHWAHLYLPISRHSIPKSRHQENRDWMGSLASRGTLPAVDATHPSVAINGRVLIKCLAWLWFSSPTATPSCGSLVMVGCASTLSRVSPPVSASQGCARAEPCSSRHRPPPPGS